MAGDPGRPARADRGADRLRQDARRLPGGDRRAGAARARRRAPGRDADRLRVAAQGAVERHQAQPGSPARRHPRCLAGAGTAGRRHPHLGAHRRHAFERARPYAPLAAAHRGDHAGVALRAARLGVRPRDARDHPDRDRRRDPRAGAEQARHAFVAVARATRRAVRRPAAAHRALRHPEADRRGRAVPGRRRAGRRSRTRTAPSSTPATAAPATSRSKSLLAARSRDVGRRLAAALRPAGRADRGASHHAHLRQYAPDGRADQPRAVRAPGRGARDRAPRQHGQGAPARRRAAAQGWSSSRRWWRPRRSSSASTSATSTWSASSARRARSRASCSGSGAPAMRSTACPRAGCSRSRATSWSTAPRSSTASAAASSTGWCCRSSRSTCWRSRSSPKWRRASGTRTSSMRGCAGHGRIGRSRARISPPW